MWASALLTRMGLPSCITSPTVRGGLTPITGFRKAYAALTFKMPTSQVSALCEDRFHRGGQDRCGYQFTKLGRRYPLKVGMRS